MDAHKVKRIHFEITTKCNAHCPACARNNSGFGISKKLVLTDMSLNKFVEITKMFNSLEEVQLCGSLGDPIASSNFTDIIDYCISEKLKVDIHTNGSLKTKDWWSNLAERLYNTQHKIIFGIDGLEGVHELYRQGTNFNKIIENAKAFIDNKGHAEWQFILFKHNKHQVKECMQLSRQLGFKKFYTKNSIRIPNNGMARNYKTGESYLLERVNYSDVKEIKNSLQVSECLHVSTFSVYVNANGEINPCCFLTSTPFNGSTLYNEIITGNASEFCIQTCGGRNYK
jgi:MoaA/NifB/PqqE/SkfB family radical SAM enzyme